MACDNSTPPGDIYIGEQQLPIHQEPIPQLCLWTTVEMCLCNDWGLYMGSAIASTTTLRNKL